jgi:antitoxin component YwqK of YwqJK toxin-antitoxin module
MLEKTHYLNGQRIWILDNNILNFYYKNGKLKAEGKYLNDEMQGEWFFYDQVEQLIQI